MFCRGLLKSSNAWVGLMSAAFLALLTAAGAGRVVVIEDWTTDAVNRRGIPSGWTGEAFGRPAAYDFTIEQDSRQAVSSPSESKRAFDHRKRHHRQSESEGNPNPGMDLEGHHSTDGRRLTADRNHRYGRPTLCRMAAVSRTPSLANYRLCLGRDDSRGDNHKEPKDRDGHVCGDAFRIKRPRQVADGTPQCRRGLCEDIRPIPR